MPISAGAGAIAASVIGGAFGSRSQRKANAANAREARLNRQFQERMAKNAHQYETEDLKKAGLNRILSITGGGRGAATPAGAQARHEPESAGATSAAIALAQLHKLKAETKSITDDNTRKTVDSDFYQSEIGQLLRKLELGLPTAGAILGGGLASAYGARRALKVFNKRPVSKRITGRSSRGGGGIHYRRSGSHLSGKQIFRKF